MFKFTFQNFLGIENTASYTINAVAEDKTLVYIEDEALPRTVGNEFDAN